MNWIKRLFKKNQPLTIESLSKALSEYNERQKVELNKNLFGDTN